MLVVDHKSLDEAAGNIIQTANQLRGTLDTMAAEVKPHVDAWGGQAKDAFYEAKRRWDSQMDGMILLLNQAGMQVDTSNAEYISTDAKSAQGFNIKA